MIQILSIAGALLILAAYGANQFGYIGTNRIGYAILNLVGSSVLAIVALIEGQWGFLLLEGIWAIVSSFAVARFVFSSVDSV